MPYLTFINEDEFVEYMKRFPGVEVRTQIGAEQDGKGPATVVTFTGVATAWRRGVGSTRDVIVVYHTILNRANGFKLNDPEEVKEIRSRNKDHYGEFVKRLVTQGLHVTSGGIYSFEAPACLDTVHPNGKEA